jgi:PAS domain S-box-containing protein
LPAFALELIGIGAAYYVLAKLGLRLASIHPSATPIWPPSGFALAVVLLRGYRVAPAVLVAAMLANLTTAGSLLTSVAIGVGNTLEALVGAWAVNRWSAGLRTFETPAGVVRFALIGVFPTMISATVGVGSLTSLGFSSTADSASVWMTWWLGDLGGVLILTPVIILWATGNVRAPGGDDRAHASAVFLSAIGVGLIAFSPLVEQTASRSALAFFAILPLLWAALRRSPRDTATVALILSGFAIWGTLAQSGPFFHGALNDSFLVLLAFVISTAVPSLALSADVAVRRQTEESLLAAHGELDNKVHQRTVALAEANEALRMEVGRNSQLAAQLSQERVHLLEAQRLANLGSWAWEIDEDRIDWSEQLAAIYGLSGFSGRLADFLARVHPEDRTEVGARVAEALKTGNVFQLEERIVRPNGEVRYLQSMGEVVRGSDGRPVRMLGVCQDVTERRQAERAVSKLRDQLAQSQKMEALGQLTGGIAHDFNNLLTIVSGYAHILQKRLADPRDTAPIEAIQMAARRGASLTRQLLTFSRRQSLNPTAIDLRERIVGIAEMLRSSLREDIRLVYDIADDVWSIETDAAELELALLNLAINARDATPSGGAVTLGVKNVVLGEDSPNLLRGEFVAIEVRDTGGGIAPDVLPRVFEPFFTTKPVGKGTGLGLAQVYGFAEQSGGAAAVSSELGKGTTVTIYLPRSSALATRAPLPPLLEDTKQAGVTILLVEDNHEVAEVADALLVSLGHRVLRAADAGAALNRLRADRSIDLVFSDIVMPGSMDGVSLAQHIRGEHPDMPIILTTGFSAAARLQGLDFPVIRKPYELPDLERAIDEAVATLSDGKQFDSGALESAATAYGR